MLSPRRPAISSASAEKSVAQTAIWRVRRGVRALGDLEERPDDFERPEHQEQHREDLSQGELTEWRRRGGGLGRRIGGGRRGGEGQAADAESECHDESAGSTQSRIAFGPDRSTVEHGETSLSCWLDARHEAVRGTRVRSIFSMPSLAETDSKLISGASLDNSIAARMRR